MRAFSASFLKRLAVLTILSFQGGFIGAFSFATEPSDNVEAVLPASSTLLSIDSADPSSETLRRQLQEVEQKLNALESLYSQRIMEMETTIKSLKEQIEQEQPHSRASGSENLPIQEQKQPEIGDILIFGDEDSQFAGNSRPTQVLSPAPPARTSPEIVNSQAQSLGVGRFQNILPDISLLGDFMGYYAGRSFEEGRNRFSLREVELALQAAVDPYARADFFLAKPEDESLEVEEGYVTILSLPGGLQGKIGRFRSAFGRINRIHGPELPQVDRPNVITNFFGEEGLVETGINLSKILPTPWFSSLELEIANGDNETLFGFGKLSRPLLVSHLKSFFDLTSNSSLQIGLSSALGPTSERNYTRVHGIDMTYRWVPPQINRSFTWQTELLAAHLENPAAGKENLFGMYSFIEQQLSRRWYIGARFDYSQIPLSNNLSEWAIAPYLNFWQSEFGRLRLEYKHTARNNALSSDQLWLQYTATLGSHRPHPF